MGEESNGDLYNFLGGLVDTGIQVWQNKKHRDWASEEAQHNRDFQLQMYERQLDDSIAWRTHQEEYNSPESTMQRYRDAGINPMYVVGGAAGGTSVSTPMQANGSGYGSSTPSPTQHRLTFAEAFHMRNEARLTDANIKLIESEAREHNANAQSVEDSLPKTGFFRQVWEIYSNMALPDREGGTWSTQKMEAGFMFNAKKYELALQLDGYMDARDKYIHSREVREFEKSLHGHQRSLFREELNKAKSASELFRVAAKWAIPNQWINASSKVLGGAAGLVGSLKGLPFAPMTSQSEIYKW